VEKRTIDAGGVGRKKRRLKKSSQGKIKGAPPGVGGVKTGGGGCPRDRQGKKAKGKGDE